MKVLLLGKKNDLHCSEALRFMMANASVESYLGEWGDPFPDGLGRWNGDYIISYLSRWVIPVGLLAKVRKAAVNFHPASPDYPGIGCNNFALYDGVKEYGVTCHHMAPKVDTGPIIATKRFPVFETDDVASLLDRTYSHQLALFYEIVGKMIAGEDLHLSGEVWGRQPYTRKQFNELAALSPGMPAPEIARRNRAISYLHYRPIMRAG